MYIDNNLVQRMKDTYLPGTRIELDCMGDDPRPIAPGTKGTVKLVDDIGTVHCIFDNGRCLGLIPGEDCFNAIPSEKENNIWTIQFLITLPPLQTRFPHASIRVSGDLKTPTLTQC